MIKAITPTTMNKERTTTDRTVWIFILRIKTSNGIFRMKLQQGSERLSLFSFWNEAT
jgi:hypothetical protein